MTRLGGKGDLLGSVQEMVYAQTIICPREWDAHNSLGFSDTNGSPNHDRRLDLVLIKKKKRTYLINFTTPVDQRIRFKESEHISKYFHLTKKKSVEQVDDNGINCSLCSWNSPTAKAWRNWKSEESRPSRPRHC